MITEVNNISSVTGKLVLTSAFLLMAIAMVLFVVLYQKRFVKHLLEIQAIKDREQKKMLSASIEAQEKERQRIGADIHDDIAPMLSTIKLRMNRVEEKESGQVKKEVVENIKSDIDQSIDQIRIISKDLLPEVLNNFGLVAALEDLKERIQKTRAIDCRLDLLVQEIILPKKTALQLYRMVQELCNNTLKHADAQQLLITLEEDSEHWLISVKDDGKGYSIDIERNENGDYGVGLSNLKARASIIEAEILINSSLEKGTQTQIKLKK